MTFVDYEKAFQRVDHSLLWEKLAHYDINGKILSVMENLYRNFKACVDVKGSLTDVFQCRVGVRTVDIFLSLLFIIFMNDFLKYVSSKFTGIIYMQTTPYFSVKLLRTQNAINATLSYCEVNNLYIKTGKIKFNIFSQGKPRKHHAITAHGQAIERVDIFCYLGLFLDIITYFKPR